MCHFLSHAVAYNCGDSTTPSTALEHGRKNSGYRTTAALGYVTQLSDILASIFDVHLPQRLKFVEFYAKSGQHGNDVFLHDKAFTHKIAKLNANMAYLCLSQNLDHNMIHIRQYLRNLITLINTSYADLGRRGYVGIDPDFICCLEANLADDLALFDEPIVVEYDDPITMDDDWEEWESIPAASNVPVELNPDQVIN